ncbi:MAG: hypothetical protein ACLGI7_16300 [Gammaproteobacteria bacterium]
MRASLLVSLAFACSAAGAAALPPPNPHLAASSYALPHGTPAQLDSTPVAGPAGRTRRLMPAEIRYVHLGPAHFGASISGPYPDGGRVLWSNGLNGVYKMDHERFEILATLAPPDLKRRYDEADADASIARLDRGTDGLRALFAAFRAARVLKDLSGVYTLVDRDNRFYVGHKSGRILVYGDRIDGRRDSPIELKGRFDFPREVSGPLIGINMTYDGWLVTATEHGYVVVVSRDLQHSHVVRLRHAQGSEREAARPGMGWVRNSFAVDERGGIYIASREHLHKVVWTGQRLSVDAADGAWSEPYANGTGDGSGATPTLMGFGDEDRLVAITDGERRMSLLLFWRDDIPEDWRGLPAASRRLAGRAPASMGRLATDAVQSEQSVVVGGYGALVVNNTPRNVPWYLPRQAEPLLVSYLGSSPRYQPFGVQKLEWDPQRRRLEPAWTSEAVSSPNAVPILSLASGTVYLIGARDNAWTLEALDWTSGRSAFHWVIGGQRYNSLYSGTLLDEAGRIVYGTPWGRVRLEPRAEPLGGE